MAFPQVTRTVASFTSNTTAHAVPMPAASVGDLVLVWLTTDGSANVTTPTPFIPRLLMALQANSGARGQLYGRVVDGTEGWGSGSATEDFVTSATERAVAHVFHVTGWYGTTDGVEVAIIDPPGGNSTSHACPPLTASWGSADNLWIIGQGTSTDWAPSDTPDGFGNQEFTDTGAGSNGVQQVSAWAEIATDAITPDVWTWSGTTAPVEITIVIRPAAAGDPAATGAFGTSAPAQTTALEGGAVLVSGGLAVAASAQTTALAGVVTTPVSAGALATSADAQTTVLEGAALVGGQFATAPTAQTTALTDATVLVQGALTTTAGAQTTAVTGSGATTQGDLATASTAQTTALAGTPAASGALASAATAQTTAVSAAALVSGSFGSSAPAQTSAAVGTVLIQGAFASVAAAAVTVLRGLSDIAGAAWLMVYGRRKRGGTRRRSRS